MAETRRIRVARTAPVAVSRADNKRMGALLTSVCDADVKLKSIANTRKAEADELMALMQACGKTVLNNVDGDAAIVSPPGKRSFSIDPARLKKSVSDKDFMECITVSMTKAKTVLSGKEIEAIQTTTPAKPGEPKLVVTPTAGE